MAELRYEDTSHWTLNTFTWAEAQPGAGLKSGESHDQFFDICAIEFDNDGALSHQPSSREPGDHEPGSHQSSGGASQIDRAVNAIRAARQKAEGAVVVVFAHGWNNNADWDCGNFVSFRGLMSSMAKREIERYHPTTGKHMARRVVGVYLGWEGAEDDGVLSNIGMKLKLNYYKRDSRARNVAGGRGLIHALEEITDATKDPELGKPDNSPLIMAGHSMGGLIMETAMAQWVNEASADLPGPTLTADSDAAGDIDPTTDTDASEQPTVSLTIDGRPVAGPDLVLLINPASAAEDTKQLMDALAKRKVKKQVTIEKMSYRPPLVISATSEGDTAVGIGLRVAKTLAGQPAVSAGFVTDLHTHDVSFTEPRQVTCPRASWVFDGTSPPDFQQHWHQLSMDPATRANPNPEMLLALPDNRAVRESHTGYRLTPRQVHAGKKGRPAPMWIFQVPKAVIDDHSDIFNFKAASMFLAMAQMSGAVASLNFDWPELFAP